METTFMNPEANRFIPNLTDKTDLQRSNKYIALTNLRIY